jgi:hypothetical protein
MAAADRATGDLEDITHETDELDLEADLRLNEDEEDDSEGEFEDPDRAVPPSGT